MYLSWKASKARLKEAENARRNRAEIVAALSQGQITRRDLIKLGVFTAAGLLVPKTGLSPFAKSAFADVPTGTPPSPFPRPTDKPFIQPLLRLHNLTPHPLTPTLNPATHEVDLVWPAGMGEPNAMRKANTVGITHSVNVRPDPRGPSPASTGPFGPTEGRPPGEFFAHQRWIELVQPSASNPLSPVGFVVSHGQIVDGFNFSLPNNWTTQFANSIWTFGEGRFVAGGNSIPTAGQFPVLLQARYGESVILRDYDNLPFELENNGGFGRQEPTTHNHNAHNGAESDGANNAHFFPGEYYDYHWSTILARTDAGLKDSLGRDLDTLLKIRRGDPRASTPTNGGGIIKVPGDFREIQGAMWFHDHRFFFTSENVHKGMAALLEYFSGPDRGYERPGLSAAADAVNLRFPSGFRNGKTWGNRDFDVYLLVQDVAFSPDGQLFFDIFDTDGFLGDVLHVNFQWKPTFQVLPRKYRLRILSAGMSRHIKLTISDSLDPNTAQEQPFKIVANDGNLFPHGVHTTEASIQGTAERLDWIVDFSTLGGGTTAAVGKKFYLVNLLQFSNGRKPDAVLTLSQALSGQSPDPAVGAIMQFEIVERVPSIDDPTAINTIANACGANDMSLAADPGDAWQIPIVTPVRERFIDFVRGSDTDSGLPFDHPVGDEPWGIRVNGGAQHELDARRVSDLPRPGDVEHWTLTSGGGWVHPVHLHFEEGVTMNRQGAFIPDTELLKRKDVWRTGGGPQAGNVQFQVTFSEFGGAYVNHCHNTVHEDNAMLTRFDLTRGNSNDTGIDDIHITVLPTPDPRPEGVTYVQSCFLPEGNPQGFNVQAGALPDSGGRTVVQCSPGAIGPVVGPQGPPKAGLVDLSNFTITP